MENITRQEQDEFSLRSHQRALAAQKAGRFDDETVAVATRRTAPDADGRPVEREIRFAADAMLGRLARWLRLLGFDCAWDPGFSDEAIVRLAIEEGPDAGIDAAQREPQRAVVLFRNCKWGSHSKPDPDGKLQPENIREILVGINSERKSQVKMAVSGLKWVRY